MKLHELKPASGAKRSPKRVGRGIGSGLGKTSTKGHKGQKARAGGGKGAQFEGGQTPLVRRLPKRGFTNVFKKDFAVVNLKDLEVFAEGTEVTPELLLEQGIISKVKDGVKLLGSGEVSKALTVKVHGISKSAAEKIVAAGGKVEVI